MNTIIRLFVAAAHMGVCSFGQFLDTKFQAEVTGPIFTSLQLSDGKLLVGGEFTSINGVPLKRLAPLNPDGSVDTSFQPLDLSQPVRVMAFQLDGKILIGQQGTILRLNADLTKDVLFALPE